jgi:hypothetical protein
VSNTSVKVAFALSVVLALPAALFAQQAGPAAMGNVPIPTIDPGGAGKCFQGSSAPAHGRHRPEIVHSNGVCWAPRNTADGPEV